MNKIEIKNRWTNSILFEYEKENNTVKNTVEEAIKQGANLREADLGEADLRGADLEGADLRGADLRGADLRGADLEGADLGEADLEGADLGEADLRGANLEGADLRGADLEGANLEGADLEGANLEGAYIYTSDDKINTEDTVKKFKERNNVEITGWYINRNIIPTRWSCFWKYGLIICNYEIAKPILRMTTEEAEKELSKKYECEVKIKD